MAKTIKTIRKVDILQTDEALFKHHYVGCLVLSKDNKVLLQQRGHNWHSFPGYLSEFGGRIAPNETPLEALVRELKEELGAQVNEKEVISLGVISEAVTHYSKLVYVYFWHDKRGTITGCYEGEACYFDDVNTALEHAKIMDSARWLLYECKKRKLL
ncbi:NUDIX domain-containing protein [Aquicella lusitana]|uniref:8-oxo-dGTP diphosphatase n=1 Tax=Aquicella lusitana TaxID=254246 RepID=A0A370GYS6_9COXI|nr:NUDIX hydrolase [Aquicella lusitana]RDI46993.1 8-oxo-dGTP diphosphatase [Aquicella lusitana]VVC73882.1 CTP pyrophosphohydrolase [Aquicella lusitana]